MFDIVTVGHFVIDLIDSPRITFPKSTLGGSATFVSLAASKLGAKASVVSKVGNDFEPYFSFLRKEKIDVSMVQTLISTATTSFAITYSDGKRRLQLGKRAPSILPKNIPDSLKARTIHIAPVANEVPIEVIRKVRNNTPMLSIDPQGFLREFDEMGYVKPKKLETLDLLQHFDIYKSSIQEIGLTTGLTNLMASIKKIHETGPKIVLATMGRRGIAAYIGKKFYHIPACEPRKFKDPTGAGDVFIGAFLAESMQEEEPLWCCCVGSAAASFVVEEVGAQHFGEKDAIYEKAAKIYDKGIKPLSHNIII